MSSADAAASSSPAPTSLSRVLRWGRDAANGIGGAILPATCVACDRHWVAGGGRVCDDCRATIDKLHATPYCGRCGRSMSTFAIRMRDCPQCMHERHWNVKRLVRVGPYDSPLRDMLVSLKYRGEHRIAAACGRMLADSIATEPWSGEIDLLVPVPMHYWRRWQRPCNHAEVLAEAVSRRMGIPLRRAAVHRPRYAPSQTEARSRAQRFEHVKDSFAPSRRPGVEGRRVCIVDNVVVTGATLHEVSKVLRKAGAAAIYAAVFARSAMPGDQRFVDGPDIQP